MIGGFHASDGFSVLMEPPCQIIFLSQCKGEMKIEMYMPVMQDQVNLVNDTATL